MGVDLSEKMNNSSWFRLGCHCLRSIRVARGCLEQSVQTLCYSPWWMAKDGGYGSIAKEILEPGSGILHGPTVEKKALFVIYGLLLALEAGPLCSWEEGPILDNPEWEVLQSKPRQLDGVLSGEL